MSDVNTKPLLNGNRSVVAAMRLETHDDFDRMFEARAQRILVSLWETKHFRIELQEIGAGLPPYSKEHSTTSVS